MYPFYFDWEYISLTEIITIQTITQYSHNMILYQVPNLGRKGRVHTKQKGHIQSGGVGRSVSRYGSENKCRFLVSSQCQCQGSQVLRYYYLFSTGEGYICCPISLAKGKKGHLIKGNLLGMDGVETPYTSLSKSILAVFLENILKKILGKIKSAHHPNSGCSLGLD